jgi:hypothetical protein
MDRGQTTGANEMGQSAHLQVILTSAAQGVTNLHVPDLVS